MYENTPSTLLEKTAAVQGYIPEQAVMFENRSHGDAMFVANVHVRRSNKGGIFVSNSTCAEYYISVDNQIGCSPTFDFLILHYGEFAVSRWAALSMSTSIFQLWHVNSSPPNAAYMRQWIGSAFQIMTCRLFGANPLFKPMSIGPLGTHFSDFFQNTRLHSETCIWKYRLRNGRGGGDQLNPVSVFTIRNLTCVCYYVISLQRNGKHI